MKASDTRLFKELYSVEQDTWTNKLEGIRFVHVFNHIKKYINMYYFKSVNKQKTFWMSFAFFFFF